MPLQSSFCFAADRPDEASELACCGDISDNGSLSFCHKMPSLLDESDLYRFFGRAYKRFSFQESVRSHVDQKGRCIMDVRNEYTEEFRRETADYVIAAGRPVSQMAEELGMNKKTLSR